MCGIVGYFRQEDAVERTLEALKLLENRGRDGCGIGSEEFLSVGKTTDKLKWRSAPNCLGHRLHSVVGSVAQPLKGKGLLVANCEIYNWKGLAKAEKLSVANDAQLLLQLCDKYGVEKTLELVDGVYAFAYWHGDEVWLARDIMGVKPIWFSGEKGFAFASERKVLRAAGKKLVGELNPRRIVAYNIGTGVSREINRKFFPIEPEMGGDAGVLAGLLEEAVRKQLPEGPVGVLLSGGVDSALVALLAKKAGGQVTLYTAGVGEAKDEEWARLFAEKTGLQLRVVKPSIDEVEAELPQVVKLIEDNNVVKAGVALPIYFACKAAAADGVKVIFSGSGSDELFGGYARHKASKELNKDCLSSLLKIYETNNYRDDVVTMNFGIELRVPFLDEKVVAYGLRVSPAAKIKDGIEKWLLRNAAEQVGLPSEFAWRKKQAAQYGSGFDKAVEKLAKRNGFASKSAYLKQFYEEGNLRLGVLYSGGKDSNLALQTMQRQNYSVECLIVLKSANPDSYMFHTPAIELAKLQGEALGIPVVWKETLGVKDEELKDLEAAIAEARQTYHIEGVVTGALYSNYQRTRVEAVCEKLGLKCFSPLWHSDQEQEMRQVLREGFEVWLVAVAAEGLDKSWLGRRMGEADVDKLVELSRRNRLNVAGEGGEFESLILDGPNFRKKLVIEKFAIEESGGAARLIVEKASLVGKKY